MSDQTLRHASLWTGAVIVGLGAVLYARLISVAQRWFFSHFSEHPYVLSLFCPVLFVLAVFLVRKLAPDAKGSGIPQVLEARELAKAAEPGKDPWLTPLVSVRTASIKVVSSILGILGGASIGREGPTVQIASSAFAWVGRFVRKRAHVDFSSFVTVGAAAGVAAAFNTPLAGITFAIEEVAEGEFGSFRQPMIVAVIISGITAQALMGDNLYFGRPNIRHPDLHVVYQALLIGVVGGLLGGSFARILAYPAVTRLPKHWIRRALVCGMVCAAIGILDHGSTAGSGYEVTKEMLSAQTAENASILFPLLKFATTVFSYLSGMAGGIFSPCLSIGAGVGIAIAKIAGFINFRACALMGMVAFFSAVVQAPLTAVVIVTEMTDKHLLIIPFLAAAFVGQVIGRRFLPTPLYRLLATRREEG